MVCAPPTLPRNLVHLGLRRLTNGSLCSNRQRAPSLPSITSLVSWQYATWCVPCLLYAPPYVSRDNASDTRCAPRLASLDRWHVSLNTQAHHLPFLFSPDSWGGNRRPWVCALPCVCTALCVHHLLCAPPTPPTCVMHLSSFRSTKSLLCSVSGPTHTPALNKTTPMPALGRLVSTPPCVCTAWCVYGRPFPQTLCTSACFARSTAGFT